MSIFSHFEPDVPYDEPMIKHFQDVSMPFSQNHNYEPERKRITNLEFNKELKALDFHDRCKYIEKLNIMVDEIFDGICRYCGAISNNCQCQNDE